jgi:hypothetical protein
LGNGGEGITDNDDENPFIRAEAPSCFAYLAKKGSVLLEGVHSSEDHEGNERILEEGKMIRLCG